MSCWRTYVCDVLKNVDKDIVDKALKDMDCTLDTTQHIVRGTYESRQAECDGVIMNHGRRIDVGVIFDDGTGHLQLVGDFYGSGFNAQEFQDALCQTYQKINIMAQAELNGWTVDEDTVTTTQDGSVEMELYMYA